MNDDFLLGREFYSRTQDLNPDSSQKLLALLIDFTGSDEELASAFRLLFSNPIYVSLFIARKSPSIAELASLSSISAHCLSSVLADRVDNFSKGYFDAVPSKQPSSTLLSSRLRQTTFSATVVATPTAFRTSLPPDSEEATLFVDEPTPDEPVANGSPVVQDKNTNSRIVFPLQTKSIILAAIALLAVLASFKVPAICEPFGLCAKKSDNSNEKKTGSEPNSSSSDAESLSPLDVAPDAPPVAPAPADAPEQYEAPVRSRPPVSTPSREIAPTRDQPLW